MCTAEVYQDYRAYSACDLLHISLEPMEWLETILVQKRYNFEKQRILTLQLPRSGQVALCQCRACPNQGKAPGGMARGAGMPAACSELELYCQRLQGETRWRGQRGWDPQHLTSKEALQQMNHCLCLSIKGFVLDKALLKIKSELKANSLQDSTPMER